MSPNGPLVYKALDKLGVGAVRRAWAAFSDTDPQGLAGNFLARAFGPKNALVRYWLVQDHLNTLNDVCHSLWELTPDEVDAINSSYYYQPVEFQEIIQRWIRDKNESL